MMVIEFFMPMSPPTITHQEKQVHVVNGKPACLSMDSSGIVELFFLFRHLAKVKRGIAAVICKLEKEFFTRRYVRERKP